MFSYSYEIFSCNYKLVTHNYEVFYIFSMNAMCFCLIYHIKMIYLHFMNQSNRSDNPPIYNVMQLFVC